VSEVATTYRNFPRASPKDLDDVHAQLECAWRILNDVQAAQLAPEVVRELSASRQWIAHCMHHAGRGGGRCQVSKRLDPELALIAEVLGDLVEKLEDVSQSLRDAYRGDAALKVEKAREFTEEAREDLEGGDA
jgi:hypothetical protein